MPIAGAEVSIGGVRRSLAMTGPRWMAHAVEAARRLDEAQLSVAERFVREAGRA